MKTCANPANPSKTAEHLHLWPGLDEVMADALIAGLSVDVEQHGTEHLRDRMRELILIGAWPITEPVNLLMGYEPVRLEAPNFVEE